jgi:hypothetical protein
MSHRFNFNNINDALAASVYFIESGDSFTRFSLWLLHNQHAEKIGYPKVAWEEVSQCFCQKVGQTTYCHFSFAYIEDRLVCFYYPTSQKVDSGEVETFLDTYWSGERKRKCDAMNFGQCIGYLRQLNKQ